MDGKKKSRIQKSLKICEAMCIILCTDGENGSNVPVSGARVFREGLATWGVEVRDVLCVENVSLVNPSECLGRSVYDTLLYRMHAHRARPAVSRMRTRKESVT